MELVQHYLVAAGLFVAIDAVWLTVVAGKFYKDKLGKLLAPKADLKAAAIFYAIYILAILVFVVERGLMKDSLPFVIGHGAFLGLSMYATYDLTNQATLKNWPKIITVVDLIWGTVITATVSTLTYLILN